MDHENLSDFLPYLLFQAAEQTGGDFQKRYQARYGMLRTEWRVMFHLGHTGQKTAKQICEFSGLHKTKVSRAVRALEQKRFLSRETNRDDRRSELLMLTKSGQSVLADLSRDAARFADGFVRILGPDRHSELVAGLKDLIAERNTRRG